ncbi:MAG: flavodoxin [Methanosarcina sp.]
MLIPVFTFLEEYDFSEKTIVSFCTYEGSVLGRSEKDIIRLYPRAILLKEIAIHDSYVSAAKKDITNGSSKIDAIP